MKGLGHFALLVALTLRLPAANPVERPGYNVLWIMADEVSPHAIGSLGNPIVQTPNIDRLAGQGTAFTSAYCQNPICVPSRASFLTGRTPSKIGVYGNAGGLDPAVPTMAGVFKAAGYQATWIGKQHWGGISHFDRVSTLTEDRAELARRREAFGGVGPEQSRAPEAMRVTDWPETAETDAIVRDHVLEFLTKHRDTRFFLGVSFLKPHFPFTIQQKYYDRYRDIVDAPEVTPGMITQLPAVAQAERKQYGFDRLTQEQIRQARAVYYGMVSYMDGLVGEVLAKLDELGLRERTIVVFMSDHGELAGEHGLWYKNSFYEASVRVPLFISLPGVLPAGQRIDAPVMNMDLFPTLAEICGVPLPSGIEGSSLVPLMNGQENGSARVAFSESFRAGPPSRMVRKGPWKYCYFHHDCEQLFDLQADPAEADNLIAHPQHQALVQELRALAMRDWPVEEKVGRWHGDPAVDDDGVVHR